MKKLLNKIKSIGSISILMIFIFNFIAVPPVASATTIKPSAPASINAASSSYNSINISWNGVTGASGYEVYRATSSSGSYGLVTRTTAKSYNNTGLTAGKVYYYKVRAYKTSGRTRIYGSYSSKVSSKPMSSKGISALTLASTSAVSWVNAAASSYSSINISWSAVAGASGYEVYRATSSSGSYGLVTRTTAKSYNNTGLTAGKVYYYKVRAYKTSGRTRIYGSYSSKVSSKPVPSAPTSLKAAGSSQTSINTSWSRVTGANGYELYKASSASGAYSLISTTTSTSFTSNGLSAGATYYYKVRSYRTLGKVKLYGNFSAFIGGTTAPINVSAISLNKTASDLNVGDTDTLTAVVSPSNATNKAIKWTSSNNNIAIVDGTGEITSVGAGTVIITATTVDGNKTASCTVTVNNPIGNVTSVSLNKTATNLALGYTDTLTAAVSPSNAANKAIKWTSSNNNIAIVDGTGKITSVGVGTVIITATTVDGNKTASCTVTVNNPIVNVTSVSLNKTSTNLALGYTDILTATVSPSNAANKAIKWTSSNNNIAVVDGAGKITSVGVGTVIITATTVDGSKTASCTVNVQVVNVTSVSLNKTFVVTLLGNTDTIKATVYPSNSTNQAVTWTSSDSNIVTVDNAGKITPKQLGTVIITATTVDGKKTANCTVTISNVAARGIDVSRWQNVINWDLVKNDGIQFTMLRASYGDGSSRFANNGSDYMYEANYTGAKASGIAVGAYHYSYATTVEQAVTEANFFISKLQGKQFEYPICVDIEDPSQGSLDKKTLTDITLTYLTMLKQAGYYPMVYASKYWFTSVLDDSVLTSYDHWLAQYANSMTYTGQAGMWQYTSSGTVDGINTSVDIDASFVDYAAKIKTLHLNGF